MSNEELACKIRDGAQELLPDLWAQVERFAAQQARRAVRSSGGTGLIADADDLYHSAYIALVDAVKGYDEEKGAFLTWYNFALQTAFAEELGYRTKLQRRDPIRGALSLDSPVPGMADVVLADTIADPNDQMCGAEEDIWREELHAAILEALSAIPAEYSDVLRRRYYQRQTLAKAAQETGRKPEEVRQMEFKAIHQLRRPQIARNLRPFAYSDEDVYAVGLQRTGLTAYMRSGESSVERTVFQMDAYRMM